jgi:hypothetical protein
MYLVPIAWLYVVVMMAAAEATSPQGTLLGALFTFLLYGALPLSIVIYLMGTPARRRARRKAESEAAAQPSVRDPDGGGHAAGDTVAPVREKP